ncbi:MAG: HAD family phosphatase [Patescibacteria group bacterium]
MIRAVIFDMDGVIIDSEPRWTAVFESYFRKQCGNRYDQSAVRNFNASIRGTNWPSIAKRIQAEFRVRDSRKKIIDDCAREAIRAFDQSLRMIPGALHLIRRLKRAGYPLALASSSPNRVIRYILKRYALRRYFKYALSGMDVRRGKPWPDLFLKAARLLGSLPRETLVIEDSGGGIRAAHRAGMKCIAYKQPYTSTKDLKTADLTVKAMNAIKLSAIKRL